MLWLSLVFIYLFIYPRERDCYSQSILFFFFLLENICHVDAFASHCQWRKTFASLSPQTMGGERLQIELRTHHWAPNKWITLKAEVLPFILWPIIDIKCVQYNSSNTDCATMEYFIIMKDHYFFTVQKKH